MIKIFKSRRTNNRTFVIRQLILAVIIVAIWPVYNVIVGSSVNQSYYYIVAVVLIGTSVRECSRERVFQIEFNTETHEVIFYLERFFSRRKQKKLQFKNAKLEVDTQIAWRRRSLIIYFLSNKVEVFKIENPKDGFSKESLENIRETAVELGLPISKY